MPLLDKAAHVEVEPGPVSASKGRRVKFKQMEKGFSTEVKLAR